jgi:hypothetical protein
MSEQKPDEENARIFQGLPASPANGQASAHRRRRSPQEQALVERRSKRLLAAASLVLVTGAVYTAYTAFARVPVEVSDVAPANELIGTPEGDRLQAESKLRASRIPTQKQAGALRTAHPVNHQKARARLMSQIVEANGGQAPEFFSPARVTLKPGDPPIRLYCLLREPLDDFTQAIWTKAGMLRNEFELISPYLRQVTIDNPDALAALNGHQVESVSYDVYKTVAPAQVAPSPVHEPKRQ